MLTITEQEQLSAILSSLNQTKEAQKTTISGSGMYGKPVSADRSIPQSPFQLRQAEKRQMKQTAMAGEAKRRLQSNPWARMLASSIRKCQATDTRLPRDLLVEWTLVENPRDEKIYLLPNSLTDMSRLEAQKQEHLRHVDDHGVEKAANALSSEAEPEPKLSEASASSSCNRQSMSVESARPLKEHEAEETQHSEASNSSCSQADTEIGHPRKVYIRPSYNVLMELGLKMLAGGGSQAPKGGDQVTDFPPTSPGAIGRLLPSEMKERATQLTGMGDDWAGRPLLLTNSRIRKLQWHGGIGDRMLHVLSLRVATALEGFVIKNQAQRGPDGRLFTFPSPEGNRPQEHVTMNSLHGIDKAMLLWFGGHGRHLGQEVSSESVPSGASDSSNYLLKVEAVRVDSHSAVCEEKRMEHHFTMNWKRRPQSSPSHSDSTTSPTTSLDSQHTYIPPSIDVELPMSLSKIGSLSQEHSPSASPTAQQSSLPSSSSSSLPSSPSSPSSHSSPPSFPSTSHQHKLPIFDLSALIGSDRIASLCTDNHNHSPSPPSPSPSPSSSSFATTNTTPINDTTTTTSTSHPQFISQSQSASTASTNPTRSALAFDDPSSSGWVLVKGGWDSKGFKTLAAAIWQLWLYRGGRRMDGDGGM